jgi:hypothetical protein
MDYGHELGFGFVLATDPGPTMLTTFMEEVAPEVRKRVAGARGGAARG